MPPATVSAAAPCTLCIVGVQTSGTAGADAESKDIVVISNRGTANITSVQLRYITAAGIPSEASVVNIGTVNAGATRVFVADPLAAVNPAAESLKSLQLASAGGALVIGRSTSSTVYDALGWGSTLVGYEGAPVHAIGNAIVRRMVSDQLVDTDQNAADFTVQATTCSGLEFNEIQPFVTDSSGGVVDAWVELRGNAAADDVCMLAAATGATYLLPSDQPPGSEELVILDGALDDSGNPIPLHLGETNGQLWLAAPTLFGTSVTVLSPTTTVSYSTLARGQTYAAIDGLWRRTYLPTPGTANEYLAAAPQPEMVSTACETVLITELVANPMGEDTEHEWVELYNGGLDVAPIGTCQVAVNGLTYGFLDDEVLAPGEYKAFDTFYTSGVEPVALNLRNSEENIVGWQRALPSTPPQLLQQLAYTDAPEGQSWSRYDVGWRWDDTPTPNSDNSALPDPTQVVPIEQAAPITVPDEPVAQTPGAPDVMQRADISVIITELLPNPAAPLNDDTDEFVELFNNGDEVIVLRGYKLQVGSNYAYTHTFTDEVLLPHGYLVVTSGTSSISLSNTTGRARLTTAAGDIVYQTDTYGSAVAGAVWGLVAGKWQWTYTATPALANVLSAAPAKTTKASTTKAAAKTTKTSATKAATTSKAKQASTPVKTANSATTNRISAPPLHIAVLAVVGGLAVLYAAYEYRHDIANRIYQFRQYRTARRLNRQQA